MKSRWLYIVILFLAARPLLALDLSYLFNFPVMEMFFGEDSSSRSPSKRVLIDLDLEPNLTPRIYQGLDDENPEDWGDPELVAPGKLHLESLHYGCYRNMEFNANAVLPVSKTKYFPESHRYDLILERHDLEIAPKFRSSSAIELTLLAQTHQIKPSAQSCTTKPSKPNWFKYFFQFKIPDHETVLILAKPLAIFRGIETSEKGVFFDQRPLFKQPKNWPTRTMTLSSRLLSFARKAAK